MKAGLIGLLSVATTVAGHGFITELIIDGKSYPGYDPWNGKYADGITQPWSLNGGPNADGPAIFRFYNSLLCQRGPRPAQKSAPTPAGSNITFNWSQWPEAHKGPILTYLAECDGDCKSVDNTKLKWFKIDEAGLIDVSKNIWASDVFMKQGDAWHIQIPKNVKSGNYVMRHELISLESTNTPDGVQFYPTCVNLEITGGTADTNPQGVILQEVYVPKGPGLDVGTQRSDPPVLSYTPPGPPIDPSLGAVPTTQLNTGASSGGRVHKYPNPDHDPYASIGGPRFRFRRGSV
ncbi:Endoglucanase-4 [Dactylellina cionopaga]|nr:Endoglucanase-4 [Dactylellina cionopaga]